MSKVLINESTLTAIADAIRSKNGSTAQMLPSAMATAIENISAGVSEDTLTPLVELLPGEGEENTY